MSDIKTAIQRLKVLAMEAISDYNRQLERGGDPVSPDWTEDLLQLIEAHAAAIQTASTVRDMLRDDFRMADVRDEAVAESVRAWYLRQYPHLAVLADQPDLAAIISGVRAVPFDPWEGADCQWTAEELAMIAEFQHKPRPAFQFNRVEKEKN